MLMNLTSILLVLDLTLSHISMYLKVIHYSGEDLIVCLESVNSQLYALGLSSKTDVHGFDSKLLCLSSDIVTPIITTFANASLETNRVLNDWKLSRVTPIL